MPTEVRIVQILVVAVGVLIVGIGVSCLLRPRFFNALVERVLEGNRLYLALALRALLGLLFVVAADTCRQPLGISVLGWLMIAAAAVGLFLGLEKLRSLARRWLDASEVFIRCWAVIAALLGVYIAYAGS